MDKETVIPHEKESIIASLFRLLEEMPPEPDDDEDEVMKLVYRSVNEAVLLNEHPDKIFKELLEESNIEYPFDNLK